MDLPLILLLQSSARACGGRDSGKEHRRVRVRCELGTSVSRAQWSGSRMDTYVEVQQETNELAAVLVTWKKAKDDSGGRTVAMNPLVGKFQDGGESREAGGEVGQTLHFLTSESS